MAVSRHASLSNIHSKLLAAFVSPSQCDGPQNNVWGAASVKNLGCRAGEPFKGYFCRNFRPFRAKFKGFEKPLALPKASKKPSPGYCRYIK